MVPGRVGREDAEAAAVGDEDDAAARRQSTALEPARDVEERGDWVMEPVDEKAVPNADKAAAEFAAAMDAWDEAAADAAIVGLARTAGANETYEHLFRYGMRDFRSIGHKAIYVANSLRTLNCIGWRHA